MPLETLGAITTVVYIAACISLQIWSDRYYMPDTDEHPVGQSG
jgi:hypothetical protein